MNISDLHTVGITHIVPIGIGMLIAAVFAHIIFFAPKIVTRRPVGDEKELKRRVDRLVTICLIAEVLCIVFIIWQAFVVAPSAERNMAQHNIEALEQLADDEYCITLTDIDLDENDVADSWSLERAANRGIDATDEDGRSYRFETDNNNELVLLGEIKDHPGMYGLVESTH